jgi:hypothetical protein
VLGSFIPSAMNWAVSMFRDEFAAHVADGGRPFD